MFGNFRRFGSVWFGYRFYTQPSQHICWGFSTIFVGDFPRSDIACEKMLFKFVTGHGERSYVNERKNKDKLIVWSMLVF